MVSRVVLFTAATVLLAVIAARAAAQQAVGPQVGDLAPDFSLQGASKFGVREKALRLSDFRGQVVVLSFFPRARTKG